MMVFKNCAVIVVSVLLVSCAGAPVGYGGTTEVVFADRDTIKVQWDNVTSSEDAARSIAIKHCMQSQRSVQLVDGTSDPMTLGLIRSRTWKCVKS
jgi:hypothetical protein